jgi:hypothetical protein
VRSVVAKLSPRTVADALPVCGTFLSICEATGASKVTWKLLVPATAATVTVDFQSFPKLLAILHTNEVEDDHIAPLQSKEPTEADIVKSEEPKLRPVTVTDTPTEVGRLMFDAEDTTAASNVNRV